MTTKTRLNRHLLGTTGFVLALVTGAAAAQAGSMNQSTTAGDLLAFAIDGQDLNRAVLNFAQSAGVHVFCDAAKLEGKQTKGVTGTLTPEQALARMLADTGLRGRWTSASTVRISYLNDPETTGQISARGQSITLEEISVAGEAGTTAPSVFIGRERRGDDPVVGYKANISGTATKTDTPIRDTPQSITVVPRQVIEDREDTTVTEALALGGVLAGQSVPGGGGFYNIRGINVGRPYRDGVPYTAPNTGANFTLRETDAIGIERVEVLKGPASLLYGRNEVGGLINFVSRRPSFVPSATVEGNVGSFDFRRFAGDVTGPIQGVDGMAFRLNGTYTKENSFIDFVNSETFAVRPSLLWQPTADFRLYAIYEHEEQNGRIGFAQIPYSGAINPKQFIYSLPRSRYFGEPTDTYKVHDDRFRSRAEWDFAPGWRATTTFAASSIVTDQDITIVSGITANNTLGNRLSLTTNGPTAIRDSGLYFDQNVTGDVALGPTRMKLLVGYEHRRDTYDQDITLAVRPPISILNPQYGNRTAIVSFPQRNSQIFEGNAFYGQGQWYLSDNLILVGGVRYDTVGATDRDFVLNTGTDTTYRALSPRGGLIYRPIDPLSLYFSWSQSFIPLIGTTAQGQPFKPETGETYEVGAKIDWVPAALSSTVSLFDTTRSGVLTTDSANPFFQVQTGEQRYRGIEASLEGAILPGWSVFAFYTFLDAKYTRDNAIPVGNRVQNVPDHAVSFWSSYTVQTGDLRGLQFGAGAFFVGSREANTANTFRIDPYVRVDAAVSYTFANGFKIALSGRNLLNERYFATIDNSTAYYGAPRTVLLTASARF